MSSDFIGDGAFHDLKNGWSYAYVTSSSDAFWKEGSSFRFSYNYTPGQWWDYRNSWGKIGITGVSQSFVGDGAYHNLGCGWQYAYVASTDDGFWKAGSSMRFSYNYVPGQWWDYLPSLNKFGRLGQAGISNSFIGDAQWHQFATNDYFYYDGSTYY